MMEGKPLPALLQATYTREKRLKQTGCPSLREHRRAGLISDKIQSLIGFLSEDFTGDHVDLVVARYKGILEDVKGVEPEFTMRLLIELGSGLGRAISTSCGSVGAAELFTLIDRMGVHYSRHLDDPKVVPEGLIIPISIGVVDNPPLLAALWLTSILSEGKSCVRPHEDIHEKMCKVARSAGSKRDSLRSSLGQLALYPPAANLCRLFDIGEIGPLLLLDSKDFIARASQAGGADYLAKGGYDLNYVYETVFADAGKGISHKRSQFLLALMEFQGDAGDLNESVRKVRAVALLKAILAELNNRDGSKLKGWKALVTKLLPFAPADLSVKEFIALGRMMPVEQNPGWGKSLSQMLPRTEFRAKVRKTVSDKIQFDVVRNLKLESFYTLRELHQMGGMRGILRETVENLDVSPENDNPALRVALISARALIDNRYEDNNSSVYEDSVLSFMPFMSRKLSELPLVVMARKVIQDDESGLLLPTIRWPESLEKRFDRISFKHAVNALIEPEKRYQVVRMLRLECLYSRQQIFSMKGERLSVDLGL